jgi:hypothetical protein
MRRYQFWISFYQNLSAVNSQTLSGLLDLQVARELLLKGNAEVVLKDNKKITSLKYVYLKDALGGAQGAFYANRTAIYTSVISFGE